jgi:glutamate formiminotransferase
LLECVVNVSEGRDDAVVEALSDAAGPSLRDVHRDPFHHRSVFTLIDEAGALLASTQRLAQAAYARIDLRRHEGVHPRFGVVDVVPFVALAPETAAAACALRDEAAEWFAQRGVGVFLYGPARTLPEARALARAHAEPDLGPATVDPARGVAMVGCREILVAWNLWLEGVDLAEARRVAAALRRPGLRTLGLAVGAQTQVSCNLVDLARVRPSEVYDAVWDLTRGRVARAELVGLAPRALLEAEEPGRWRELGLSLEATIEARVGR